MSDINKSLHKLAELIREGAKRTEKCKDDYLSWDDGDPDSRRVVGSCSIGAAYVGAKYDSEFGYYKSHDCEGVVGDRIGLEEWADTRVYGPTDRSGKPSPLQVDDLGQWMIHLNDEADWSREQIADWIDYLAGRDSLTKEYTYEPNATR